MPEYDMKKLSEIEEDVICLVQRPIKVDTTHCGLLNSTNTWTSLQQLPWGQKEVAVVESF